MTREPAHQPVTSPSPKPARPESTRGTSSAGATPESGHELLRVAGRRAASAAQGTIDTVASLPRSNVAAELDAARGGGEPRRSPLAVSSSGAWARTSPRCARTAAHEPTRWPPLSARPPSPPGRECFLHRSAPQPTTPTGRGLLAHELVHVLQQSAGPVEGRPGPGGLRVSDPDDRHERAAARAGERVASGAPVDLGLALTAPRGAPGVVVQRQTPAAAPETSIGERVAELERRQSVTEARQASVDQDARWRGTFGARFSSSTQAILRVSGALQGAHDGFSRAQVEQAEFDQLANQLLIAAVSVGFAAAFEPLLSALSGAWAWPPRPLRTSSSDGRIRPCRPSGR